jgi:hypothetical protein
MCEAATIALASYGEFRKGETDAKAYRAQRDAELTAAGDARGRGNTAAGEARMAGSQAVGDAKVALAASGVDTASGSPLNAILETRAMSELDAQTARNNAAREAWGHEVQATAAESAARNAKYQGRLKATGTFLSGISQLAKDGAKAYAGGGAGG